MNLSDFAQGGIAIFSIAAILYIVHMFVGFMRNHISHSIKAQERLTGSIEQLLRFLERTNGKK